LGGIELTKQVFLGLFFAFFYVSAFAKTQLHMSQDDAFNTLIVMNAVGLPGYSSQTRYNDNGLTKIAGG
jgi:hypothetical protein